MRSGNRPQFVLIVAAALYALARIIIEVTPLRRVLTHGNSDEWVALAFAGGGTFALSFLTWRHRVVRWTLWPNLLVATAIAISSVGLIRFGRSSKAAGIISARTFYGVSQIHVRHDENDLRLIQLNHGNINHGVQIDDDALRLTPTTYYTPSSGVGLAARFLEQRSHPTPGQDPGVHFGVLGLGTGTMAAYAQPGDSVRFYEINPLVIDFSMVAAPIFTFVRDCRGKASIATGDARLSLESELKGGAPQCFDLLVLDVFSSDAIPVHLLTSEAFDLYAAQLRNDDSIIAVHISNRFLDLEPVVAANARRLGLQGMRFDNEAEDPVGYSSRWILLVRNPRFFEEPDVAAAGPMPLGKREVLFTDRYSNLFTILRRFGSGS